MSNIQKAFRKYEQMLLDASKYSGNSEPGKKSFSASQLGSDMLQIYLKYKNGSKETTKFGANTIGSIYQLGVDVAADTWNENLVGSDDYTSAKRIKQMIDNGWEISGEMDQIDNEYKVIFDNKVSTATTIKKIREEGKMHGYALQLGVYKWLMWKETGEIYKTALPVVDKGHSHFKTNKNECLEFIEVETYSPEEIERMLYEKTNELQEYIDLDQAPGECQNLWIMARKGQKAKRMKCMYYCDQNKNCKYYNVDRVAINELLDL